MKPQGAGGTCLHGTGCTCTAGGGVKIKNRADGVSKSIFSGYRRHRHERPGPLFPARGEKGGRLRPYSFAPDGRVVGRGGGDPFRGRRAADPRGVPRPGGDDGGVYPGRAAGARRVPLFRRPRVPYREALADVGAPRRRQVRDGRGGDARQDYDVDARGMAQPRPDGWRQCLSGRYLEEFRRQPGAGRLRQDAPPAGKDAPLPDHAFRAGGWPSRPTSSTVRSCGSIPMWRWLRRPTPTTSTFTGRTRR